MHDGARPGRERRAGCSGFRCRAPRHRLSDRREPARGGSARAAPVGRHRPHDRASAADAVRHDGPVGKGRPWLQRRRVRSCRGGLASRPCRLRPGVAGRSGGARHPDLPAGPPWRHPRQRGQGSRFVLRRRGGCGDPAPGRCERRWCGGSAATERGAQPGGCLAGAPCRGGRQPVGGRRNPHLPGSGTLWLVVCCAASGQPHGGDARDGRGQHRRRRSVAGGYRRLACGPDGDAAGRAGGGGGPSHGRMGDGPVRRRLGRHERRRGQRLGRGRGCRVELRSLDVPGITKALSDGIAAAEALALRWRGAGCEALRR